MRRKFRDHLPDHLKFGYAEMIARRDIREQLLAKNPDIDRMELHFAVEARMMQRPRPEKKPRKPTRSPAGLNAPYGDFDEIELRYLAWAFEHSNELAAQSIREKALRRLVDGGS